MADHMKGQTTTYAIEYPGNPERMARSKGKPTPMDRWFRVHGKDGHTAAFTPDLITARLVRDALNARDGASAEASHHLDRARS